MAVFATATNMANVVLHNKDANRETALKLYSGEVIKAFRERNIFKELISVRTLTGGKSSQWIVTGEADETAIQTHKRGDEVNVNELPNTEITISIGDRLVYSHFSDKLDEIIAQYDLRSEIVFQASQVLSTKLDKAIVALLKDKAGHDAHALATGDLIKTSVSLPVAGYGAEPTAQGKGDKLVEALFATRSNRQDRNISEEPNVIVSPTEYYNVVQSTRGTNSDYTNGNGGIDSGKVRQIAGFSLGWSNNVKENDTDKTLAIVFDKQAVGMVSAMDLTSEANYVPSRLGDLLVTYMAYGLGFLNTARITILKDA